MRRRSREHRVLLGTLLLLVWPRPAHGQGVRPAQQGTQREPSIRASTIDVRCGEIRSSANPNVGARPSEAGEGGCRPGRSTWSFKSHERLMLPLSDDLAAHGSVTFDTASSYAAFGRTWQARAALTYRAPGRIELTAGVVGRRGYDAPLFMTEGPGADTLPFVTNSPILDSTRRPVLWDTVLRVEKQLVTAGRVRMSVVGEAYNLLNVNRDRSSKPLSSTLTSRTVRVGLKFTF